MGILTAPGGIVEHPPDGKVVGLVSLAPFTRRNKSLNNLKKTLFLFCIHCISDYVSGQKGAILRPGL
jgi:hypothetical protein